MFGILNSSFGRFEIFRFFFSINRFSSHHATLRNKFPRHASPETRLGGGWTRLTSFSDSKPLITFGIFPYAPRRVMLTSGAQGFGKRMRFDWERGNDWTGLGHSYRCTRYNKPKGELMLPKFFFFIVVFIFIYQCNICY